MSEANHLNTFLQSSANDHKWIGLNVLDWWESVFPDQKTKLPSKSVSRDELKALCADQAFSDQEAVAAVLAWGGMRRNHGRGLSPNLQKICRIVASLRSGQLTRYEAFSAFYTLRLEGSLTGMSAAYFTKLIFFCAPKNDGYIMDQWTSKSVNLISGKQVVNLTHAGHVSDHNTATTYIKFCEYVEELSKRGCWTPEETEIRLFSYGGRNKGEWRSYVIANWSR